MLHVKMGCSGTLFFFSCLVIVSSIDFAIAGSSKYSREKNQLKEETLMYKEPDLKRPSGPFRISKLNAVWEKAQKRVSADDLPAVLEALRMQDKDEITLKQVRHDGGDKDGSMSAELTERLRSLMEKYGLTRPFSEKELASSPQKKRDKREKGESTSPSSMLFKDKKLNKLWEKAQRLGYSETELESLKSEFDHHQQKLDEYYQVFGESSETIKPAPVPTDVEKENQIGEDSEEKPEHVSPEAKLDTKLKSIVESYEALKARTNRNNHESGAANFKEMRTEELWNLAMEAGFTRDELQSLREELGHFDRKLAKLKHFNDGVQNRNEKSSREVMGKGGEKSKEILDLELKAKFYAQKVENLHKDIEHRIASRHNEL